MPYAREVIEKVKEEYDRRRKDAFDKQREREREMYTLCPMLLTIDEALDKTGLKVYQAALAGRDGLEERIAALEKENRELLDDKKRLLKLNGKPSNYLDVHYTCSKCQDTGYVGMKTCGCLKKALAKEAYLSSGLGAVLTEQSFDNFDLSLYPDKEDEKGVSPRKSMAYILSEAKDYVKDFLRTGHPANLLFVGGTGLGKTHLSSAIGKSLIDKGVDVVYETVQNVVATYEKQTFDKDADALRQTERYRDCGLLILDDLGTEFKSSFTQSVLYGLLNARLNAGRPIIASTNLDESELFLKFYDDRITSRLVGSFRTFRFVGEDIRIVSRKAGVAASR